MMQSVVEKCFNQLFCLINKNKKTILNIPSKINKILCCCFAHLATSGRHIKASLQKEVQTEYFPEAVDMKLHVHFIGTSFSWACY